MTSYSVLLLLACITTSLASILHWSDKDGLRLRSEQTKHVLLQDVLNKARELRAPSNNPVSWKFSLNDHSHYGLIHYSGNDSKVIFVLTYNRTYGTVTSSTLYRSADYGTTFTNINSRLDSSTTHLTLYPHINISPEDYRTIIISHESKPYLYISKNEGVSFTKITLTPSTINPHSLLFSPIAEKWFLAHDPTNKVLYVSTDLGQSLTKLSDNVASLHDYQWGVYPYDIDRTIVYYNTNPPNSNTTQVQLYIQHSPYTTSTVSEFDPNLGKHDAFLIVDRYIFAQKTVNNVVQLYTSHDRKPFKLAHIPSSLLHKKYIVASIKALQALVIVQHTNGQFNLYLSEEAAQYFSLSLSDIVVSSNYVIDLELIESMNYTTYIANQNVRSSPSVINPPVHTLISFDAGGNWEKLRPPSQDSNGNDIQCLQPSCSLHLHMDNSQYRRTGVYSQDSAPGIIIAHGSTGASLSASNVNLYISRDGGSTWYMTLQSTWGVAVMDHGGLIVAAKDYHSYPSKVLKYSCDEGNHWTSFIFSNRYTVVFGVFTEPGETTTVVSLYGIDTTFTGWVVIRVNFTNIFPSKCGNSDFYKWTPYDETTDTGCLLGGSVTIERRLNAHCCLIGKNYVREINYTICACSEDDFECDYGYKHANGINGRCIRDNTIILPNTCTSGVTSYIKSQGYRKIGGDICSGCLESQYAPVEEPCYLTSGGGTGTIMSTTSRIFECTTSITSQTSGPTMSTTSRTSGPTMSTTSRTSGPTMSTTSKTSGPTMSTTSRTSGPTTNTTSRTSSTTVPTNAATKSNSNVVIGLGVVFSIAILVIFIMFIIMIFLVKKFLGNKNRTQTYHTVPPEESFVFRNEHEGSLIGVPFKDNDDDNDDDEKPLTI